MSEASGFTAWLEEHTEQQGGIGSFARAVAADPQWPGGEDLQIYVDYLQDKGVSPEVEAVFREAWDEFLSSRH
jgi:YozE SAM-like fold